MKGLSAQRHRAAMPTQSSGRDAFLLRPRLPKHRNVSLGPPRLQVQRRHPRSRRLRHIIPHPLACYASRPHRKYGLSGGFLTNIIPRRGADGMLFLKHNLKPSEPEFAKRRGQRPLIVRCASPTEEATAVATSVQSLLAMGHTPGQICIVGPSVRMRDEVQGALLRLGVHHAELRQDADFESDNVKVSTIESAKGHEFRVVFIYGSCGGRSAQCAGRRRRDCP